MSSGSGRLLSLYGRRLECAVLDELLEQVRRGRGTVLVLRGEAGVGKTALLEYVAGRARGCRLARVTGVQSEMELAFAGLHQLCAPMLTARSVCRCRSGRRCGPRSGWPMARRRTGSWSGWPC